MCDLVLLGVCDEVLRDSDNVTFATNHIGGKPTWMGDTLANPVCPFCGQMLLLTVQIYCPLGGSAYHRTLYIFCCIAPTCWNKSESWKVIRTQTIDTEVEAVSTSAKASVADQWCLSEDDWGDEEDGVMSTNNLVAKEDDLGDTGSGSSELNEQTCNRCVPNAATVAEDVIGSGDRCSSSSEPSQEVLDALHAMTVSDTASLSSAEIDAETTDNVIAEELRLSANAAWREVAEVVTREEGVRFGAFYISAFEEGTPVQPDTAHITHLLVAYEKQEGKQFQQLLASASSGSCGKVKAGSEGYEKGSARHGDQVFQSFHKKIQACPQQCLRYCIGGKPLHIRCIKKEQQIIPPCKSCGSPRQYEMQLMPTLVSILKLSNQEVKSGSAVEFGTILIYTCQNSCWKDGDVSHEEYVILEADPDQEQFQ
ncbi:PREDICTED: programmed cell death protein 2-like [Priapulus caudatus]|uniref:Programmed cell death protein 2-like n=1 Tax=Priapulus caudatus TaxID=37621 RepID=A0ABM1FB93_PRICU|nr:PREDICTED: programmed cell death protein 2-like [Priapulus caudatus]